MPEVLLRVSGENARAVRAIEQLVSGLKGVQIEAKKVGPAAEQGAEEVVAAARAANAEAVKQIQSIRGQIAATRELRSQSVAGSDEMAAATKRLIDLQKTLTVATGETAVASSKAA